MVIRCTLTFGLLLGLAAAPLSAQEGRGRKYKAPPETSHIEVVVLKDATGKPVPNAAVVFHSIKDGQDEGNLEVKTNEEGKAVIDVIPTGSAVDVQVIADGFATFASTYQVNEPSRAISVRMVRPRAQISTYVDNRGQVAQRPAGIQEPNHPHSDPNIQQPQPSNHTSDPTALAPGAVNDSPQRPSENKPGTTPGATLNTNPSNMHPDNQYPLDPATAPKQAPKTPAETPQPPQL